MAQRKGKRRGRKSSLKVRFRKDPIATTKREINKIPGGNYAVASVLAGVVGGAAMVSQLQALPLIGPITGSLASWGHDSWLKIRNMG